MILKRVALALLAAALLAAPGCSSPGPSVPPDQPNTYEPAPAAVVQKARIAVPYEWQVEAFDAAMKKTNDSLAAAGQNVAFEIQKIENVPAQSDDETFLQKVKAELAAGAATADAYLLSCVFSGGLFDEGLTMDVTALTRQNAPIYCSKYDSLFPEKLTGIPVGIFAQPMWSKAALMLREDFAGAGKGIQTLEGLFRFIDETIVKPGKKYSVLAYSNQLLSQWALENGYYPLDEYGLNGYLYCAVGDRAFTPVPIETIPGFAGFLSDLARLRKDGVLSQPFIPNEGRECIAFVYSLSFYYYPSPYLNNPIAEGRFAAQLLSPEKPGFFSEPAYTCELVIPKAGDAAKAAQVARFVEWMYDDQENYDKIIYGEKGVDFVDEAGRYTPLIDGKPLPGTGYGDMQGLFFLWPAATSLSNSDFYRMPSTTPANVGELTADGLRQDFRFPLSRRVTIDESTIDKLMSIGDEAKQLARQRLELFARMIDSDPEAFTEEALAAELEALEKLNNKWLCEQYAATIKSITEGGEE